LEDTSQVILKCNVMFPAGAGPGGERIVDTVPVAATQGAALCFYHGNHPLSHLHEGSVINAGTKYIIRTDVLYMLE
jgi:hypothetical protein